MYYQYLPHLVLYYLIRYRYGNSIIRLIDDLFLVSHMEFYSTRCDYIQVTSCTGNQ